MASAVNVRARGISRPLPATSQISNATDDTAMARVISGGSTTLFDEREYATAISVTTGAVISRPGIPWPHRRAMDVSSMAARAPAIATSSENHNEPIQTSARRIGSPIRALSRRINTGLPYAHPWIGLG